MSVITVRKILLAEAIQINSPGDEKIVRRWLGEWMPGDPLNYAEADLEDLKARRVYFLRDKGSPIVYITSATDFQSSFEAVDDPTEQFTF